MLRKGNYKRRGMKKKTMESGVREYGCGGKKISKKKTPKENKTVGYDASGMEG